MTQASALYRGNVTHRRLRPRDHRLNYRVFWLLLDLAEIDGLDRRLRLFSRNRFNLVSFHDRDHGDGSGAALRPQIEAWLERRPEHWAPALEGLALLEAPDVQAEAVAIALILREALETPGSRAAACVSSW